MLVAVAAPNVVLLDIGLAGVDGVTALCRIRARQPELPIIVCGANVDIARDTLKRVAFDYVAKPVDFDHLALPSHIARNQPDRSGWMDVPGDESA